MSGRGPSSGREASPISGRSDWSYSTLVYRSWSVGPTWAPPRGLVGSAHDPGSGGVLPPTVPPTTGFCRMEVRSQRIGDNWEADGGGRKRPCHWPYVTVKSGAVKRGCCCRGKVRKRMEGGRPVVRCVIAVSPSKTEARECVTLAADGEQRRSQQCRQPDDHAEAGRRGARLGVRVGGGHRSPGVLFVGRCRGHIRFRRFRGGAPDLKERTE